MPGLRMQTSYGAGIGIRRGAQENLDALRLESGSLVAKAGLSSAIADRDVRAFLTQEDSRGLSAVAKSENDRFLA